MDEFIRYHCDIIESGNTKLHYSIESAQDFLAIGRLPRRSLTPITEEEATMYRELYEASLLYPRKGVVPPGCIRTPELTEEEIADYKMWWEKIVSWGNLDHIYKKVSFLREGEWPPYQPNPDTGWMHTHYDAETQKWVEDPQYFEWKQI